MYRKIYLWRCWAGSWVAPGRYLEKERRSPPGPGTGGWGKLTFTTVFGNGVDVAGGGGRIYCGESVGAVVCIFGVDSRVGGGVVTKV